MSIKILGATLLSTSEVHQYLTKSQRAYSGEWWTRTQSAYEFSQKAYFEGRYFYNGCVDVVYANGSCTDISQQVYCWEEPHKGAFVRPSLLVRTNLSVGDRFYTISKHEMWCFEMVATDVAFIAKDKANRWPGDIGCQPFDWHRVPCGDDIDCNQCLARRECYGSGWIEATNIFEQSNVLEYVHEWYIGLQANLVTVYGAEGQPIDCEFIGC